MLAVLINSMTSGGAEKVVHTLISHYLQNEVDVHLICVEKEQYYPIPEKVKSTTYLTNYDSLAKSFWKFPMMLKAAWKLKSLVKKEQIDTIQCHLLRAMFISVIAQWLGSAHQSQIILHSRINFDSNPPVIRGIKKWIYKKILFKATAVISICDTMKQELDTYLDLQSHPDHRRIYNPHDITEILKNANEHVVDIDIKAKSYLVAVGRLVEGKRIDDLIQAYHQLQKHPSDLELVIIGSGSLESTLRQQATNLQIADKVHFLGYKANPYPYIAYASAVVLTSEWEGLPNILIEAMICGVPIISTDCISGPREILHPDSDLSKVLRSDIEITPCGILYPIGDRDALINALEIVFSDGKMVDSQLEASQDRCQMFDAATITSLYMKLLPATNSMDNKPMDSPSLTQS